MNKIKCCSTFFMLSGLALMGIGLTMGFGPHHDDNKTNNTIVAFVLGGMLTCIAGMASYTSSPANRQTQELQNVGAETALLSASGQGQAAGYGAGDITQTP